MVNKIFTKQNHIFQERNKKIQKKILLVLPLILLLIFFCFIPLLFIFIKPFQNNLNLTWIIVNKFIWQKIFLSLILSLIATIICIVISYPFCYLLVFNKAKIFKTVAIILITMPIWLSFLIKIIGLKTFFDICIGYSNSTYGHIFTIIGIVYMNIPFMILAIFNVLNGMPKNLILASYDLGQNWFKTFIKVVFPYTKIGFFSGMSIVFLSSISTISIPQFMNNNNDSSMIGTILITETERGIINSIAASRISAVSLITTISALFFYFFIFVLPQIIFKQRKIKKTKKW